MNHRTVGAVLLVLLLMPSAMSQSGGAGSTGVEWWGPTDPTSGHHIRIPVTVTNPLDVPVERLAVRAQIDVAEKLAEAGWTHTTGGGRDLLKGFSLDADSVRVVRVNGLGGSADGRLVVHDPSRGPVEKYVVPSTTVQGFTEGDNRASDPNAAPLLTVTWWTSGPIPANGKQYYHVYLDTLTNGDHPPADLSGADVGAVEAMHWTGPAARYHGAAPGTRDGQDTPRVNLVGLYPDTTVSVALRRGSTFQPHDLRPEVSLGPGESDFVGLGNAPDGVEFRLESDRPFLAFMENNGFVPAATGGYAGRSFTFQAPDGLGNGRVSATLIAPHDRPVQVTATDGGDQQTAHLNDDANGLPYTLGAWADGPLGGCMPRTGSDRISLRAGQVYQLSATDDVLVLLGGPLPMQQVPTLQGGPQGQEFAATLEEHWYGGGACSRARDDRSWRVLSDVPTGAYAHSPESDPTRIDPRPSDSRPAPTHSIPALPTTSNAFSQDDGHDNRPIFITTLDPATVFVGEPRTNRVESGGALGGADGGRVFSAMGEVAVVAYHDDTKVEVTVDRYRSGTTTYTRFLAAQQSLTVADEPDNDLVSTVRVSANKPVAAYALGDRPSYLSGLPLFAGTEVGPADFRGYLIDLVSSSGLDPVTASTVPGEPVTYRLFVENLGRTHDGTPIEDNVRLRVGATPAGWTAELDRSLIHLGQAASEAVTLTVTPPSDAAPRTQAVIPVIATSQGNEQVSVSTGTVTHIKRSFAVGLFFDVPDGPKTDEGDTKAGGEMSYKVVVQNRGTVTDTIKLSISGQQPGWSLSLRDGDQEVDELVLEDDTPVELEFLVTPPSDMKEGILVTTITGTSASQPGAFDRITAISRVRAEATIQVEYDDTTRPVLPGETVEFPIRVLNVGEGPAELDLEARADLPEGWSAPTFEFVNPATGERAPVRELSVQPGQELDFIVSTTTSEDSLAGELGTVRAVGRPPGGNPSFEAAFSAVTAPLHRLDVATPDLPLAANAAGLPTRVDLTVRNDGNLDERLRVEVASLPAGWSVDLPEPFQLARGEAKPLRVDLSGPLGAPARSFNLSLALVAADGNATLVDLPVSLGEANGLALEAGPVEPAQPGRPALLDLNVTNTGNRRATLEVLSADGWDLVPTEPVSLAAGQTATLTTGWLVPQNADGASTQSLQVVLTPDGGTPSVRTVEQVVEVGRPQVRIVTSEDRSAPAGRLVVATVENTGDRDAHDVRLDLRSGEETVDGVVINVLRSGETAVVSLLDTGGRSDLRLVLDPEDHVVESDESDNEFPLSGFVQDAPGPRAVLLLAALCLLAWVRRRSRP